MFWGYRGDFDDGFAEVGDKDPPAAFGREGVVDGTQDVAVEAGDGPVAPFQPAGGQERFPPVVGETFAAYCRGRGVQQAGVEQGAYEKRRTSGGVEVVAIGAAAGVDAG